MVIQIVLIILYAVWFGYEDAHTINDGIWIDHEYSAISRGIVIGMIALLNWKIFILGSIIFWIMFELSLNYYRENKPLLYVGITAKMDKIAHKIFPNNTGVYYLITKLVFLIITIGVIL